MSSQNARRTLTKVRPLLSLNKEEAHRRVLNLYRGWYRQLPTIKDEHSLNISVNEMKNKIKEMFYQNSNIKDIRTIDMLVIKGQMELSETVKRHKQHCHIHHLFSDNYLNKPKDFISKFLTGKDSD